MSEVYLRFDVADQTTESKYLVMAELASLLEEHGIRQYHFTDASGLTDEEEPDSVRNIAENFVEILEEMWRALAQSRTR